MLPQLRVLLVIFTALIIAFLVVRKLLIPDTFGDIGHYRADALTDNENMELMYAGKAVCIDCHSDINDLLQSDMHMNLSCEVCHGPGLKHADTMEPSDISKYSEREDCGKCHAINPAKPAGVIAQINLAEHNIDHEKCIECHNPHQVWELSE
ncbi:cytochrome c3 family protein [Bacteroidota bacterium]